MPELGKWNFVFEIRKDYRYMEKNARRITIGIYRLTSYSLEGQYPSKDNYKGFLREYSFRMSLRREI
jgi:hypothetical protein